MFYNSSTTPFLCLCISMSLLHAHADKQVKPYYNKRVKTMSTHICKTSGSYRAQDKRDTPVILEWQKTTVVSSDYAAAMRSVSTIGIDAFTSVEMDFLRAFPDVVGNEPYFKSFEPLFANGLAQVDWQVVEKQMRTVLASHFLFDPSTFSDEMIKKFANDTGYFVTIKNTETKEILGFISFMQKPEHAPGTVKCTSIAVIPSHQNRGLAKLLMSSIFKMTPDIQRIFLCTRVTNTYALNAYTSWGFTHETDPVQDPHYTFNLNHWTFMEYCTDQSDTLQTIAKEIKQNV